VVYGAKVKVKDGSEVKQGQLLVEWDPYSFTILTEEEGQIAFKDIIDGPDRARAGRREHGHGRPRHHGVVRREEAAPHRDQGREGQDPEEVPPASGAHLMVEDGAEVAAGDVLAKIPRETAKTKDITAVCPAWSSSSRRGGPRSPRSSPRSTGW
jgi:DNA-directed RNA polymerase subunit beta'